MSRNVQKLYALIGKMGADWVAMQLAYLADPLSYLRKIYVVEENFGDHTLRGIYGSRSEAEVYCKADISCHWYERDLDWLPEQIGELMLCYRVRLNLNGGTDSIIDRSCTIAQAVVGQTYSCLRMGANGEYWEFVTHLWAKDETHADEIAEKRRVDWVALNPIPGRPPTIPPIAPPDPPVDTIVVHPDEMWYDK